MSTLDIRSKFHVALDGIGLLLTGAPNYIAYRMGQASLYGNRFASGDRSYDDFSQYWFFAQTDWSGGIQTPQPWEDTKYYHSTNIDAYSVPGTLRLERQSVAHVGVSSPLDWTCGVEGVVGGTNKVFLGTDDDSDDRPNIYSFTSWPAGVGTEIMGAADTSIVATSQLVVKAGYLWALSHGTGSVTDKVRVWDGATWSDMGTHINTASGAFTSCPAASVGYDGTAATSLWLFLYDMTNRTFRIVSTSVALPTASGDFTARKVETTDFMPVDAMHFSTGILYVMQDRLGSKKAQLRFWSTDTDDDSLLYEFHGVAFPRLYGLGGKMIKKSGSLAIVTLPRNRIVAVNEDLKMTTIYERDKFKQSDITGVTQTEAIDYGCVELEGKLWWSNLMFDGEVFHNTFRDNADSTTYTTIPLCVSGDGYLFHADTSTRDVKAIFLDHLTGTSVYKSTSDANYVVFGNIDTVQSVDKLAESVTIFFEKLVSGQEIAIDYCTGPFEVGMTWTELGTADYTVDGGSVTTKKLTFPAGTTFKKMWFRVRLNGGGTNTPVARDFVFQYLPMPDQKKEWAITINAGDHLKDLYGAPSGYTGRELRALLETAWLTKSHLDYQDLDYAQTQLNGALSDTATTITVDSTEGFHTKGRIRLEDEEITYTGKTPTTFTGCTRGAKGTEAVSHSDNTACTNKYRVVVTSIGEQVPVMLKGVDLEYTVSVNVREA